MYYKITINIYFIINSKSYVFMYIKVRLNHIVFLRVSDCGARVLIKKNFQKYAKIPNLWVK